MIVQICPHLPIPYSCFSLYLLITYLKYFQKTTLFLVVFVVFRFLFVHFVRFSIVFNYISCFYD